MSDAGGRPGAGAALGARTRAVIAVALLGMLAGFAWGIADEPKYAATATADLSRTPADAEQGGLELARYADVAVSSQLAATVARDLGDDVPGADLLADLVVTPSPSAAGLELTATSDKPDFAVAVANGYARALVDAAGRAGDESPLELGAAATLPDGPSENRSAPLWTLLGLAAGLIAALAVIAALARIRRRGAVRARPAPRRRDAPARLGDVLGAPLLASIADPEEGMQLGSRGRIAIGEPVASEYAGLAAALELEGPDGLRTLAVAAPSRGEDAVAVCLGLAVAASRAGLRVLLVEADLAAPSLGDLLHVDSSPGLGDYLEGSVGPRDVLRNVRVDGASGRTSIVIVPAGERGERTPRTVAGVRFTDLVARLPKVYDLVVLVAPPILSDPDSPLVAQAVEAVLVVSPEADEKTVPGLRRAAGTLADSAVVGVVRTGDATPG